MPVLDSSFGTGGFVTLPFAPASKNFYSGNGVALQPDGKIVVGGQAQFPLVPGDFVVARYDNDGSLDPTFGSAGAVPGVVITDFGGNDIASGLAIQRDGKIVLAGWTTVHGPFEFALARYNHDGSLDASFGTAGRQTTGFPPATAQASANAIALDPRNGDIVTAGAYYPPVLPPKPAFAIARHDAKGHLVHQWVDGFGGLWAVINALVIQHSGGIVAVGQVQIGSTSSFALACYQPNGALDPGFGAGGRVLTAFPGAAGTPANAQARAAVIQADGRIVAAGVAYFGTRSVVALARYTPNGKLDPSFGSGGLVVDDRQLINIRSVAIDHKARIVVAGHGYRSVSALYDFAALRFEQTGPRDLSFDPPTGPITPIPGSSSSETRGVAIGRDGKIVGAGFAETPTDVVFGLVRYL